MEMPEIRQQRKPDPGSPNVQASPATNPAPDPRPNPIPPPLSSWKRLNVAQWIMLCILLLAITVGAAENVPVEEASNVLDIMLNDAEPEVNPDPTHHPGTEKLEHAESCTNTRPCQTTTKATFNICETTECEELDSAVQAKMNHTMDPCDDFYNYACGAFIQETPIPDGKMKVDRLTKPKDRLKDEVSAFITSPEIRDNDTMPYKLVKKLYQRCMIRPPTNPMLSMLEKLGGWAKPESSWSLVKSVDDLRSHGYVNNYFIRPSVEFDWKNASRRIIYIDQFAMGRSREKLATSLDATKVSANLDFMANKTVLLGADKERAKQDVQDIQNIELKMANISLSFEERRNLTTLYNRMSVEQLQSTYGYINWLDYFRVVFKDTGIVIDKNETVIVKAPSYFEQLGPFLQTASNRSLVNYVMWRVVAFSSRILDMNLHNQQQTNLSAKEEKDLSMRCVEITKLYLPIAVSAWVAAQYAKEDVNGDSRRATMEMANELRDAFVGILKKADWMDTIATNSCLEKVNAMAFLIGYPDELLDDRKIVDYYRDLQHKLRPTDDYLSTVLRIIQFNTMQNFKLLRKAVNKTDWTTCSSQAEIFASYNFFENSVQMTTGHLQALFLPHDLPRYMNYGAIGPIIGRYITQACDHNGRDVDSNGNVVNWWQEDTKNAFEDKHDCYKYQYGNYTEPNLNISLAGCTTAFEDIADHGGLKVAYKAYKKWADMYGPEPRLPRLKLSSERMFWLSAAQTMCSVYREEEMKKLIAKSYESPDQFRVVGAMGNMDEFSADFSCPTGSPMNRTEKCKVW